MFGNNAQFKSARRERLELGGQPLLGIRAEQLLEALAPLARPEAAGQSRGNPWRSGTFRNVAVARSLEAV